MVRVAPELPLSASIFDHLCAAGVTSPADVARDIAAEEYETLQELLGLSSVESKGLFERLGLKHKSSTKLSRYLEDLRLQLAAHSTMIASRSSPGSLSRGDEDVSASGVALSSSVGIVGTQGPAAVFIPGSSTDILIRSSPTSAALMVTLPNSALPTSGDPLADAEAAEAAAALIVEATRAGQERGDFAEAVALFREAIATHSGSSAAWFGLGFSLYQRDGGNTEEQAACYEKCVALDPKNAMAHTNLGTLLQTLRQDIDGAEWYFKAAIAIDSKCADAHNHLGFLLQDSRGDLVAAESCYRRAIELDASYADALVNLGNLLHSGSSGGSSLKGGPGVSGSSPGVASGTDNGVERAQGLDEAESCYRRAIEVDPAHARAIYQLAELLSERGDLGAEASYRRFVHLFSLSLSFFFFWGGGGIAGCNLAHTHSSVS